MSSEKLLFRLEQPHGMGDIYIAWQKGSGMYLATTGVDSMVNIFDRYGDVRERIKLPSLCTYFSWDNDGDILGIICQSPQLILWDANTQKKNTIDVGLKDLMTCLIWGKKFPVLAIGTAKGNVSIYNHTTTKRTPVIGKHSKKITCGAWNSDNLLALGSDDKTLSISNIEGDTLRVVNLRAEPSEINFSEMKTDERASGENTVSLLVARKTLYLYNLLDPENPIELAFQPHYGAIINYKWYGDGYILIGFANGYFIAISTHIQEVGQELFQIRNHKNSLTDIAINEITGKAASCGDNTIKIHDLANLQETSGILNLAQEAGIDRIAWSTDGQLLGVCTKGGSLNVYVSYMAVLTSVCPPRMALLSSLTEISLYNYSADKTKLTPVPITLEIEPSFIAVGPYHLAAGMNNNVWFYDLTKPQPGMEDTPLKLKARQYLGTVTSIRLNSEYVSVLFEGRLQLHMIESSESSRDEKDTIIFPDNDSESMVITCHELTTDFLIYATDMGHMVYFLIEEWAQAMEYKHTIGIKDIYVDPAGTRLVLIDAKTNGYVFDAVSMEVSSIPHLPNKVLGVTWDSNITDRNIFILHEEREIYTYIYVNQSTEGSFVKKVGQTVLASKQTPLLMYAGEVMSATSGGQLTQLTLSTHDSTQIDIIERDQAVLESNFNKQISLHRFGAALETSKSLKSKDLLKKLAEEALKYLEIETALRIYKELEDVSMVLSLESISDIEDRRLLCGYICMFLKRYDEAQKWFLESSFPNAALEMRRDLLQWDQALQLAKKMATDQVAMISREYAQQLEFVGNYPEALRHYEKGLQEPLSSEHSSICRAGIARTNLHCSNYRHGMSIALEMDDQQLLRECADILDRKKRWLEAAQLHERCRQFEAAAANYIKLREWAKAGELLAHHTASPRLHAQHAAALEAEGRFAEAAAAYQRAGDLDSAVRLHLERLDSPETAVELARRGGGAAAANMVARFFLGLNDAASAIEFLVLSRCTEEAFDVARSRGKVALYGELLLGTFAADEVRPRDFVAVAEYFENERDWLLAGKYWFHARDYQKAMRHLLKAAKSASTEEAAIATAIDVCAASADDALSDALTALLLGDADGVPRDPRHLLRLCLARGRLREAASAALVVAGEEQNGGNYRSAHDVLWAACRELRRRHFALPRALLDSLASVHGYILVRLHVKRGEHMRAARLLMRVADRVSKFPSHVVPILTSTVIECHRAGLRQAAYKYATMLMNPEYRKSIDPKYSKKIEAVVRKPPKSGKDGEAVADPPEPLTPCPYCDNMLPESEVTCSSCKSNIPFCIVTGCHIVNTDLTACPECDFPALRQKFVEFLEHDDHCPMCSEKVDPNRLVVVSNTKAYLNIE